MSFQLRNLMKGTGQIVEWSVRDESLHSKAGCWLFRTLLAENPKLDTELLRTKVSDACHLSVQLEFDFIDKAFEMGSVEGLNKNQLKNFIKARANEKMVELGYKAIYNDIDPGLTTLQADPGTNRTALQALQIATESEYGAIYVSADNNFVFQDRGVTAGSIAGTPTVFADGGP